MSKIRKVKIYGAGSIGNHLAHASRNLNWEVDVCDISKNALSRTRDVIYPQRYGKWDKKINLIDLNIENPKKKYDLIIIGTPPDTHIDIIKKAIIERPKYILIEKPLCQPDKKNIQALKKITKQKKIKFFVGYNHTVSSGIKYLISCIIKSKIGKITSIDIDWREHWQGILNAHPWLNGPKNSYLGYWQRGGGALGEHSHGMNLLVYLLDIFNLGKPKYLFSCNEYSYEKKCNFDKISLTNIETDKNLFARVSHDVVTNPPKKSITIYGSDGIISWKYNSSNNNETVILENNKKINKTFIKNRSDDFFEELKHIQNVKNYNLSPINIKYGIQTMNLLYKSHKSAKEKKIQKI